MPGAVTDMLELQAVSLSDSETLALVYAGSEQAHLWRLTTALRNTILKIASLSSEAATLKLQWWQDEIRGMAKAQARHPLSKELLRLDPDGHCQANWLEQYLIEVRARVNREQVQSDSEARLRLFRVFGVRALQLHAVHAAGKTQPPNALTRLAIANGLHTVAVTGSEVLAGAALLPPDMASLPLSERSQALTDKIAAELDSDNTFQIGVRALDVLAAIIRFDNQRMRTGQSPAPLRRNFTAWRAAQALEKNYARDRQAI